MMKKANLKRNGNLSKMRKAKSSKCKLLQPLRKYTQVKIEITVAVCYNKFAIIKIYYYKGKLTCVYLW